MSRYIDADAILNEKGNSFKFGDETYYHESIIQNAPTVDAVPVEWIENYVKWLRKREIQFAPVAIETMLSYYKDSQPYCDSDGERRTDEQP